MLAIFYNRTSLKDTLIIQISPEASIKTIQDGNFTYGLSLDNKLTFINIFNFSELGNEPNGYLMLDKTIADIMKKHLNIDLSTYNSILPFIIGHVVQCEDIPNSHLHKCKVDIGKETLQIVCGASNVRQGLNVIVAQVGATMPNGLLIKKNKLLGKESDGMICSVRELDLKSTSYNKDGIVELNDGLPIGQSFISVFANSIKE
ncbi:MAG: tRNA-binding protein [Mycoplasmataceae bacterium]|jgi:tRNA-binding protein|nr:tRNA-binding protein [Mycoplasmataceae bacterium]